MSRIIKSYQAKEQNDQKVSIKIREFPIFVSDFEDNQEMNETSVHERIEQAHHEAENILNDAKKSAETLLLEVHQQREKWDLEEKPMLMEQAQKEGYQQGMEDGRQQGYSEMAESIAYAREIIELSKIDYANQIEAAEPVILELALKVAGKIIGLDISENQSSFLSIVKRAIKEARDYREVQLHVHPNQYPFILSQKIELEAIFPKNTDFYIYPNEDLQENSCMIESENGRIDASVDSQLIEMKNKLMELLKGE